MAAQDDAVAIEAAALSTQCTLGFLQATLPRRSTWRQGLHTVSGQQFTLELRDPSPTLAADFRVVLADDVSMRMYHGQRNFRPGFGVPVVLVSERCDDAPACRLLPVSGVFRSATAWVEADERKGSRVVLAHPDRTGVLSIGSRSWPLAMDSSAFYAAGLEHSPVGRLAIWSFFGGQSFGRRAGVYLLEDYAPEKCPLVMVHGLASTPLTWASLSNAVWSIPDLRERYQVWQLLYETDAPMLVARSRVEKYIDDAFALLDPMGVSRARRCMVLVGHSMGGVVTRLLSSDSGDLVWNAAFTVPISELVGDPEDLHVMNDVFRFEPYPGIRRAILIAAPHRGSPAADAMFGRIMRSLVRQDTPEVRALQRIARRNPDAVPEGLRYAFVRGQVNSISSLRSSQPVMRATHSILPDSAIPYHTIAGLLPGAIPEGDGLVPLQSALLPGAASELVVISGHNVHENPEAIGEVLRILLADKLDDIDKVRFALEYHCDVADDLMSDPYSLLPLNAWVGRP